METFIASRDGKHLKELASAITSLLKRKKIKDQIKSLYHNFEPIKGLSGSGPGNLDRQSRFSQNH